MAKNRVEINGINTSRLNVLSYDDMVDLFNQYKNGNKEAKDKLVEGNLKLVLSILRKYQNKCDNLDDLFQIGVVGLIKAIDNFDLAFGVKFSTYAVLMIEGEIKRYLRDDDSIRVSRSVKELSYQVVSYRELYLSKHFRYPTNEEVCNQFNISEYELYNVLNSLTDTISIFEPTFNDNGDAIYLIDQIEDKTIKDLDNLIALKEALSKIKDREKLVIMKRYVDGLSQSEIASILNISQAQVSRIENNALNSIKKLIL